MIYRLLVGTRQQFGRLPKALTWALVTLAAVGMGLAVGRLMTSAVQPALVSLLGILVYFVAIIINPLAGTLLWLAALPFTETVINISLGAGVPDVSPTRFTIVCLTTLLLAQIAIRKRPFGGITSIEGFGFLFIFSMGLSALTAVNLTYAMQIILDAYVVPLIAYFILRHLVVDRKTLNAFLATILVIAAYSALYAIFEQLTGIILFTDKDLNQVNVFYSKSLRLLVGLYEGPHVFGTLFTVTIPILFYLLLNARKLILKNLYIILLVLEFVGLYFTYKRTSWVAMLVGFLIMMLFYPKFRRLFIILLLFAGLFLAFNKNDISNSAVVNERLTYKVDSLNGRTERWDEAWVLWQESPIIGQGFRVFDALAKNKAVESMYLHILVSAGIVGLIPYLLMVASVFKDSTAIFRRSPSDSRLFVDRNLVVAFWAGYATYLVKAVSGIMLEPETNILIFAFIGAVVGSQERLLNQSRFFAESSQDVNVSRPPPQGGRAHVG